MADDLPDGYHTITPYFTVRDADALMVFLVKAFAAEILIEKRQKDDTVQHARVRIGDSIIMLNQSSDAYPVNTSQMHLYVEDAEAAFATALRLGAKALMEPNTRPHGDRMAGIEDPCGNIWWLVTLD